jgi:hypothetical protein
MNELLMKRIERRLVNLADEQGYQVLDYVEFLETKYAAAPRDETMLQKLASGVEDTLRAGRIPVAAIRGTMKAMDSASRLMEQLAQAGRAAVEELGKTVSPAGPSDASRAPSQGDTARNEASRAPHDSPNRAGPSGSA